MAKWDNDPDENTDLNSLKVRQDEEESDAEKEAKEAEAAEQAKLDEEEAKRAEEEAAKNSDDDDDKDDEDDDDDVVIDLDEIDEEEKKAAEEAAAAEKAKADEGKTDEELAKEKEEADAKAAQDEADAKAKEEEEAAAKLKDEEIPQEIEIKIGEETYDAERATSSIKKLNEIENDEFLKNLIEHRLNGGDALDYLKAYDTREDEMSDLELARYAFENDPANEGMDREDLDLLWNKEVESRYNSKSEDEEEKKLGSIKLKQDGARAKADIRKAKSSFKIAAPKTEVASELVQAELEKAKTEQTKAQAESLKQWNDEVDNHEVTKTLREKGQVIIEVDGKKIGFKPANVDQLVDVNKDLNKFISLATDKDGHMKLDVFNETMAFATNKEKFKSDLVKYGRMLERKATLAKSKNIDPSKKKDTSQDHDNKEGASATMASLKGAKWGGLK
jgi:hypothetical protein